YIKIVYHPHSGRVDDIIRLDTESSEPTNSVPIGTSPPDERPWAPFRSRADFEFAESAVNEKLSRKTVDTHLKGMHGPWSRSGSNISFQNHDDLRRSLDAARDFVTDFKEGSITARFDGKEYTHRFYYRDIWEWTKHAAADPELCKTQNWHAYRKYYCEGDYEERIIDDLCSADEWWDEESTLPAPDPNNPVPHCLMPYVVWLDKGMVGRKRRMHPGIVRPGWQPCIIRNGSGNGGGTLFIYLPISDSDAEPDEDDTDDDGDPDFKLYIRIVYHKILAFAFQHCKVYSHVGYAMRCGDDRTRVIYPCVILKVVDGEEASILNAIRSARSDYPCPQCLIFRGDLADLSSVGPLREDEAMKAVYEEAKAAKTKKERERTLQQNGLHLVKNFLWDFGHTRSYAANGYEKLHSDDGGKIGHHLWPLIRDQVVKLDEAGFNRNMGMFPPWINLEKFDPMKRPASLIDFSDGNTFVSVLKCLNPSIVQILPANSSLVECAGWLKDYRMINGLSCVSVGQLRYLQTVVIPNYQRACERVSDDYGKNFAFYKQHAVAHVVDNIMTKGALQNQDARPGEGFQQEVKQQFNRTDKRNAEKQMTRIDSEEEAIAQIRMAVDIYDAERRRDLGLSDDEDLPVEGAPPRSLGSASRRWTDCTQVERALKASRGSLFHGFEEKLRKHVCPAVTATSITDSLQLDLCRCIYMTYSSVEDFRAARDILRCNERWYGNPRFDSALISGDNRLNFARVHLAFKCKLIDNSIYEFVAVTHFKPSSWKPRTVWSGCHVYDEKATLDIIPLDNLIRGALMCPSSGAPVLKKAHYLVDCIDSDMFLRVHDLAAPLRRYNT
ncbi:hypothetical protein EXIGLDRAFT_817958, partial [Exidia glandulosa HHB12029]